MSITSLTFLAWLALVVLAYHLAPASRRWWVLLAADLWFYLSLDTKGLALMLAAALVTWWCACRVAALQAQASAWKKENKALPREERRAAQNAFERGQKRWVALAVLADLGILFLVKYYGPMAAALNTAAGLGLWRAENLLIPLGISYYSFHLISYLVDVYRALIPAERNPLRVITFAGFFLAVTQGPFIRYGSLMPQLEADKSRDWRCLWNGAQRMAWGYFQKMAVADRAAIVVNRAFRDIGACTGAQLFFGILCFAVQLYGDFCGYTNIVLGAGEMLGLELPPNFRQPFFSRSLSEFWQRWHISLGAWLKDYLFYPVLKSAAWARLGAWLKPRVSKKLARKLPTWLGMLVLWAAIGLWHGARINYVFGVGILQFLYIFLGELLEPLNQKASALLRAESHPRLLRIWQSVRTTACILIAWVFFRAETFSQALAFLGRMLGGFRLSDCSLGAFTALGLDRMGLLMLVYGALVIFLVDLAHECGWHLRERLAGLPLLGQLAVLQWALWSMLLLGIFLSVGEGTFLYARF